MRARWKSQFALFGGGSCANYRPRREMLKPDRVADLLITGSAFNAEQASARLPLLVRCGNERPSEPAGIVVVQVQQERQHESCDSDRSRDRAVDIEDEPDDADGGRGADKRPPESVQRPCPSPSRGWIVRGSRRFRVGHTERLC
jgi:hypothetical protein